MSSLRPNSASHLLQGKRNPRCCSFTWRLRFCLLENFQLQKVQCSEFLGIIGSPEASTLSFSMTTILSKFWSSITAKKESNGCYFKFVLKNLYNIPANLQRMTYYCLSQSKRGFEFSFWVKISFPTTLSMCVFHIFLRLLTINKAITSRFLIISSDWCRSLCTQITSYSYPSHFVPKLSYPSHFIPKSFRTQVTSYPNCLTLTEVVGLQYFLHVDINTNYISL